MDLLLEAGYDVRAFTSAKFTYPEFDRTLFAGVPSERLHEGTEGLAGWQNDRANVDRLLTSLDERDTSQPFFRFMFFESPHARYAFPPDSVIREDYAEDLDYATLDLSSDVEPIRNRYLNACHHLDSQYGRVLDGLAARGLLDATIVILTGDHGEEFMEHGRWGHNSDFTDAQVLTPLVLWVPGKPPATVTRMSSHLDLPATLLTLLGVTTPESEYTLGHDLFGPLVRERCVISDWDEMALVDARIKLAVPFRPGRLVGSQITTAQDGEVEDEDAARAAALPFITDTLAEMGRFLR
jgi:membrane-anchored protein YejM (alkaline phosphatase superfamily)